MANHGFYSLGDSVREIPADWQARVPEARQAIFFDLGRSIVREPAARDALAEFYLPFLRQEGEVDWARKLADRVREPAGATFPLFVGDPTVPSIRALDELVSRNMSVINFESRLVNLAQRAVVSTRADDTWRSEVARADSLRFADECGTALTTLAEIRTRRMSWKNSKTLRRMECAFERLLAALTSST